jgi:pyruvate/2-oxoglutarate dehydrogenase complex dihydrolipoamide dehydrogenase (E3) component
MTPDASYVLQTAMQNEGIEIYTDTTIQSITRSGESCLVHFDHGGIQHFVSSDEILNALGRIPATRMLDLENADVDIAASGHINTNLFQQTTNPAIYAAGDCCGPHEIVHVAIMQGENAAHHALGKQLKEVEYDKVVKAVFTDPQVAFAGLSRKEIVERGLDYVEASYPFFDHGKSMIQDALYGYVRVYAERGSGVVLGAECVSKDASELIHTLAVAVSANLTIEQMLKVHWYHPTLSEIWSYPLEDAQEAL